jgi:GDPmannose 4,6-dehydratase
LEAIRKFSPTTRYINFGSSEEWGDVLYSPQDERHPPRARSPYGASKIAARQLVKVYRESYGLYAIQCWCLNYESERRGQEFVTRKITKGVARIAKAIQDGKSFEPLELGALDVCRDWSHASDFVDGVWRMLNQERYNPNFPVGACADMELSRKRAAAALNEYVLSSGETHTVREFVEKAFTVAGISGLWGSKPNDPKDEVYVNHFCVDETTRLGAFRTLVRINPAFYRPADVETLTGDSTRARTELGWRPKVTFDELVRRMVENDLKEARVTT